MRRLYKAPALVMYGSVANLTARVGSPLETDTFYGAQPGPGDDLGGLGSQDTCERLTSDSPCLDPEI